MSYKNNCQTLSHYDELQRPVYKNKHPFETHDLAVKACKIYNLKEQQIKKLVTYKCKVCHKYHIGRNGNDINAKYKRKITRERDKRFNDNRKPNIKTHQFKIIGKIELP